MAKRGKEFHIIIDFEGPGISYEKVPIRHGRTNFYKHVKHTYGFVNYFSIFVACHSMLSYEDFKSALLNIPSQFINTFYINEQIRFLYQCKYYPSMTSKP